MNPEHHTATERTDAVCLNHLRRGSRYIATTRSGDTNEGIYLGMETAHGDRAILLAGHDAVASIRINRLTEIDSLPIAC